MGITTLKQAQNKFMNEIINLDAMKASKARTSRDYLKDMIKKVSIVEEDVPNLYPEYHIDFGSFSRNTKIRPLDDIDMMFCFKGEGSHYNMLDDKSYEIVVPAESKTLSKLCGENSRLNSRKVIEKIKGKLLNIPNYNRADIKRNQEAITLKLNSYEWNFDIVPCFICTENGDSEAFYLIPDGNGNWKKTDPRKDRERIRELNNYNLGNVYQLVRLAKYWNNYKKFQSISSYLLENLVLEYIESTVISADVFEEFENFLNYLKDKIFENVRDPKGIQSNLNDLDFTSQFNVSTAAKRDAEILRNSKNHFYMEEAKIKIYQQVFGPNFPNYGDN